MNKENLQLRRLGENDKVLAFDCGDEDLNDFILTDAPLYYRVRLATSYVWEDSITGEVFGYFRETLCRELSRYVHCKLSRGDKRLGAFRGEYLAYFYGVFL